MGDINENLLREVDAGEEVIDSDDKVSLKDKVWIEMKKMWIVAGPAMFTRLSTFGLNVITQAFVGQIGSTELAAYAYVYTVLVRLANGVQSPTLLRTGVFLLLP
uniref:Protein DETOXIFICATION n=1 Tax=Fagus sylvatica TaxID=28930 RepID=A0A2N9GE22_FAGSY